MQGFAYPPLSLTNRAILIASGVFLLLNLAVSLGLNLNLPLWFGLSVPGVFSFKIYSFLSYSLLSSDPLQFLFNGMLLWFVGSELEFLWGRRKYLTFLFISAFFGGVLYLFVAAIFGIPWPLFGPQGISNALCLAYAWHFPERPFNFFMLFPIPAKIFCWIIVALQVYAGLRTPGQVAAWGHLPAMLVAGIYLYSLKHFAGRGGIRRLKIKKSNLSIVPNKKDENDQSVPPKYWN